MSEVSAVVWEKSMWNPNGSRFEFEHWNV